MLQAPSFEAFVIRFLTDEVVCIHSTDVKNSRIQWKVSPNHQSQTATTTKGYQKKLFEIRGKRVLLLASKGLFYAPYIRMKALWCGFRISPRCSGWNKIKWIKQGTSVIIGCQQPIPWISYHRNLFSNDANIFEILIFLFFIFFLFARPESRIFSGLSERWFFA